MKANRISISVTLIALLSLNIFYTNCASGVDFGITNEARLEAQGIYSYSTSFEALKESSVPIDLVWVIDNSGSMANEAEHVRKNLETFASTLNSHTDFKFALVSKAGTSGTAASLPMSSSTANFMQYDVSVGSTNALTLTSKAMCPVGQACGKIVKGSGQLSDFLRANSKKVFVVVTDDESAMSASDFSETFASLYPVSQLNFFGFVALDTSCSVSKTGSVYVSLAKQYGGDTYNICLNDWSSVFGKLAENVIAISQNVLTLPTSRGAIETIHEVLINGLPVASSDYTFDGIDTIKFAPSVLRGLTTAKVDVTYQVKKDAP